MTETVAQVSVALWENGLVFDEPGPIPLVLPADPSLTYRLSIRPMHSKNVLEAGTGRLRGPLGGFIVEGARTFEDAEGVEISGLNGDLLIHAGFYQTDDAIYAPVGPPVSSQMWTLEKPLLLLYRRTAGKTSSFSLVLWVRPVVKNPLLHAVPMPE